MTSLRRVNVRRVYNITAETGGSAQHERDADSHQPRHSSGSAAYKSNRGELLSCLSLEYRRCQHDTVACECPRNHLRKEL